MKDALKTITALLESLNDRKNGYRLSTLTLYADGSFEIDTHDRSPVVGDSLHELIELAENRTINGKGVF